MGPELAMIIIPLLLWGLGIIITVLVMRAVFMIPTIVDNLKIQTELLTEIAKTQNEILKNKKGDKD
jgi:hypothetical protein